jgi:uncharacterized Fe-S cluster-containing radical SAM superfamily protein
MELLGDLGYVESRFDLFADSVNLGTRLVHGLRRTYHRLRKSFWMHPKELLGDVGLMDPRFGLFRDSVSVRARLVHGLRRTYPRLRNHFGRTRWNC